MNWETGVDIYTVLILHIKSMSKDLVYSTGNSLSVMWQPGWEGSLGDKGYMYM